MRSMLAALLWALVLSSCGAMGIDGDPGDGDDDDDSDADTDADTDADADSDADADAGVEAGAPEDGAQTCGDVWDNDADGLRDCSDPGCMDLVTCCAEATTPLFDGFFDETIDLAKWKIFGDRSPAVLGAALFPAGDEHYESGVVSTVPYPLAGAVELSFTIAMPCVHCPELIGVALTAVNDYAESSAVEPLAGVVFDGSGDQVEVMLVVNGAVEARQSVADSMFDVTIALNPDGSVQATERDGWYLSGASTIDPSVASAYVAIFGRGGVAASAQGVKLENGACESPSAVTRPGVDPLIAGGTLRFAPSAVRAPSVSRAPDDPQLEMLFTAVAGDGTSIGRAVSGDLGVTWLADPSETPVLGADDVPIGYESPDEPALLVRGETDRVAVVSIAPAGDASQRALAAYTSPDGIAWTRTTEEPITNEGCRSLRHPALVEPLTAGEVVLYYTCENAEGYGSILRATSLDLVTWSFEGAAVLERDPSDDREMDGVSSPTVLFDGFVWELWYEARSGVNRVVRYAASVDGIGWTRWDGTVLSAGPVGAWDSLQVGDPAVVLATPSELRIYYTGLGPAGQGVGVVTHAIPQSLRQP